MKKIYLKIIIGIPTYLILTMAVMFGLGGNWAWLPGWRFTILFIGMILSTLLILIKDPGLMKERMKSPYQKDQNMWDKILLTFTFIFFMGWLVIMPLDSQRFGWTQEFPLWIQIIGVVGFLLSIILLSATFKQNTYLAPVVKIQKERGHKVISTGLYGYIRHPMYAAIYLMVISSALLLSSMWGIYTSVALIITLTIRSILEEKMLAKNLEGYKEYMKKVKARFIPFIF